MNKDPQGERLKNIDSQADQSASPPDDTEDWSEFGTEDEALLDSEPSHVGQFGRYQVLEQLGKGGFGSVYRAYDPQLQRDVAIKFPRNGPLDAPQRERFLREARAAAGLRHPHIVCIYDAGEIDGQWYISSDRIEGQSLRRVLRERGALTARESAELIAKLASALAYAHGNGVVHRDVKPENILIDSVGNPHLADFGLARRDDKGDERTQDGVRMGTPSYMSPEQAGGRSHFADGRSDLWSLGVVFHELLTGRRPALREEDAPRDSRSELTFASKEEVPEELVAICLRCLQPDPSDRYASGRELADDLQRWLAGTAVVVQPAASSVSPRVVFLIISTTSLILLSLVALAVWLGAPPRTPSSVVELRDSASVGEWAADEFFRVRVVEPLRGTLLADVNYQLEVEVENRTAMRIELAEIAVKTFNRKLNAAMGKPGDQVHSSVRSGSAEQPMHLKPRETQTIPFACGQGLPTLVVLRIVHGQSAVPSEFRIDDVGVALPIPEPRHLSEAALEAGSDAIAALQTARTEALRWSSDARLHSAFAPERRVLHDRQSGLSYVETIRWVAVFSSEQRGALIVEVGGAEVKSNALKVGPECLADLFPVIGTQEAIRIADRKNLLRADWNSQHINALDASMKNPRLMLISTSSGSTLLWFLPFLGPDSIPVTIDAISGTPVRIQDGILRPLTD